MILDDEGWLVPGVDGLLCAWHADLAEMSGKIAEQTPEHWLLDQVALAYSEPCPHPGEPPAPPAPNPDFVPPSPLGQVVDMDLLTHPIRAAEPIDMADDDAEHEARLLRELMP